MRTSSERQTRAGPGSRVLVTGAGPIGLVPAGGEGLRRHLRRGHRCQPAPAGVRPGTPQVDLDALVTGHYGLADVEQALTVGARDPGSVKVVVTPQR
jgi:hypothetical protein